MGFRLYVQIRNMFRFNDELGGHILDIKELNDLRKSYFEYRRNKTDCEKEKKHFETIIVFFDWYLQYCTDIIKGRTLSDEKISQHIFREHISTEHQGKEYLTKSIYLSADYVRYLKSALTIEKLHRYDHTLIALEIDLEDLIINYEVHVRKTQPKVFLNSYRRKILTPRDIYSAARTLFRAEEFEDIKDLYLGDLKPVVMFQIRQLLEIYARNILGYYSITDLNDVIIKKFTQVAWEFIKEEVRREACRISFPFDIHMILSINTWSNHFVHSTYVYSSYIQHFALKALGVLFVPPTTHVTQFNGRRRTSYEFADIRIVNYNTLKSDFEHYLNSKMSNVKVQWMDESDVGAYIVSL